MEASEEGARDVAVADHVVVVDGEKERTGRDGLQGEEAVVSDLH